MKQFIQGHKLLCIILACVIVAGAACAVVLPMALKHEHTFSMEWTSDKTNHWHKATCEHTDLKKDEAAHIWNDGEITTPPTETTKGVKTFTCTVCGYKKNDEIDELEHTHTFDTTSWEHDDEYHWHKATCEHTDEKSGLEKHTFGNWETLTPADYGVNRVDKGICSVCKFEKTKEIENTALQPQENNITVGAIDFTYSRRAQSINGLIEADNNVGMTVQYRVKGTTEYTSNAPVNAGTYEYLITVPQTKEWQKGEKTGEFVIEKYKVICPSKFVSTLNKGQENTNVLCEIDVSDDENIDLDEIMLIYSSEVNPSGIGAQRMMIKPTSIKVDPDFEANVELTNLPSKNVEWIVKDGTDVFGFRITTPVDAVNGCYEGTILHGWAQKGDKLILVGENAAGKLIKTGVTVTKIEYKENKYDNNSKYPETSIVTKGEIAKITFTKDDSTVVMSAVYYAVSAQDIGTLNQYQKTQTTDELSFESKEYRAFGLNVDTAKTIKITVENEYSALTVYNATTGDEITLDSDNGFNLSESTKIIVVIKQTAKGTNKIKVETVD